MEFLLTYGWAMVIVVTAIAALAYFGVLDPGKFAPSMCTLPTGLSCLDHGVRFVSHPVFGDKNVLELHIKNNLGWDVTVTEMVIPQFNDRTEPFSKALSNGEKQTLTVDDITSLQPGSIMSSGDKYEIEFTISYTIDL